MKWNGHEVELIEESGDICLMMDGFYLLSLNANGTFTRSRNISDGLGLKLDEHERIHEQS